MVELRQPVPPASQAPAPEGANLFGEYGPAVTGASAVILVLAVSVIDRLTGYDLHLSILQLVPVAMITWTAGRMWGLILSFGVVALWFLIFRGEHHYATPIYFYWDGMVLLVTLTTVAVLVARLREALRAHELSFAILEKLDAPAYVVDLQRDVVLVGNSAFRAAFESRPAEELAQFPAQESHFTLADGRPALLRILAL